MNLIDALLEYSKPHISENNEWYHNNIRCLYPPIEVNIISGSDYKENIQLKNQLHKSYINADSKTKEEIIKFYIKSWGGITKNSSENIYCYTNEDPISIIENKKEHGIASWSKALAIRDPEKFAIYDSRVAISINCLQIIYDSENKSLFPLPISRDEKSNAQSSIIKSYAKTNKWANVTNFYTEYNKLLLGAARKLDIYFGTLEMLLFSKKEELQSAAFEIINSNK